MEREKGKDILWYIWSGPGSPLFGKSKMATLERYFLKEPETHKEVKNAYYGMLENDTVVNSTFRNSDWTGARTYYQRPCTGASHVRGKPVKCNGKLLVIDGGFSKAYQKETGIAGYTLIFNSFGLILAAHEPFTSAENAIARRQISYQTAYW